jgi:hypothetical protein
MSEIITQTLPSVELRQSLIKLKLSKPLFLGHQTPSALLWMAAEEISASFHEHTARLLADPMYVYFNIVLDQA